jgi:hypothetical protein
VSVVDNAFEPTQTVINPGDTVVWSDMGNNPHTVTADDGSFDSASGGMMTLARGQTFSHTFTAPGTYPYHCRIHGAAGGQGMSGVIVVQAASSSAPVTQPATVPAPATAPPVTPLMNAPAAPPATPTAATPSFTG